MNYKILFLLFIKFIHSSIINNTDKSDIYGWPYKVKDNCILINKYNLKYNNKLKSIHCNNNYKKTVKNTIYSNFIITLNKKVVKSNSDKSNINLVDVFINKLKEDNDNTKLDNFHAKINYVYKNVVNGFSANLSPSALDFTLSNDFIYIVEQDDIINTMIYKKNPIWNLDRIDQESNRLDNLYDTGSLNGFDTDIYILDTGINEKHNEFNGRIGNCISFINDRYGCSDCNGHGTHCAGTAAGNNWGVANKAIIHSVRVLDCNGQGSWSKIIGGLDWVVEQQRDKKIASLSLGGSYSLTLNDAVNNAYNLGTIVVVAAGNENVNACDKSPASASNAVTVASSTINDQRSSFSNYGNLCKYFCTR